MSEEPKPTYIHPDTDHNVWYTKSTTTGYDENYAPIGDPIARQTSIAILRALPSLDDDLLLRLTELRLNQRYVDILVKLQDNLDHSQEDHEKQFKFTHRDAELENSTLNYGFLYTTNICTHLNLKEWSSPFVDGFSQHDHNNLLEAIVKTNYAGSMREGDPITAKTPEELFATIPSPLVKFTATQDLVDTGADDEPRLLADRPRTFSEPALENLVIPADATRYEDNSTVVLKIEWQENKTKVVKVTSSEVGSTVKYLNLRTPTLDITSGDLAKYSWSFEVETITPRKPQS